MCIEVNDFTIDIITRKKQFLWKMEAWLEIRTLN